MNLPPAVADAYEVILDYLADYPYSPDVARARDLVRQARGMTDSLPPVGVPRGRSVD